MKKFSLITLLAVFFSITIFAKTITVISPNGTEAWKKASRHRIAWKSSGLQNKVKLILMQNNRKIGVIRDNLAAVGSLLWKVGQIKGGMVDPGRGYKIQVEEMKSTSPITFDQSDRSFNIIGKTLDIILEKVFVNSIQEGDVRAVARYRGNGNFNKDVYIGIWSNGAIRKPIKKRIIFNKNNDTFEFQVCNWSYLKTNSAQVSVRVKFDATSQLKEGTRSNNEKTAKLSFAKITKINLKADVSPNVYNYIYKGKIKQINFKARFLIEGRGTVLVKYHRYYTHHKGSKEITAKNMGGPYDFYVKLKNQYSQEWKEVSWYKIESYYINHGNSIYLKSYRVKAFSPNRINSNPASYQVRYRK